MCERTLTASSATLRQTVSQLPPNSSLQFVTTYFLPHFLRQSSGASAHLWPLRSAPLPPGRQALAEGPRCLEGPGDRHAASRNTQSDAAVRQAAMMLPSSPRVSTVNAVIVTVCGATVRLSDCLSVCPPVASASPAQRGTAPACLPSPATPCCHEPSRSVPD